MEKENTGQEELLWQGQFTRFRDQLLAWGQTGALPELAGPAVREELLLRQQRLRDHELTEAIRLLYPEDEPSQDEGSGYQRWTDLEKGAELRRGVYLQTLARRRSYRRSGKQAGRFRDLVTLTAALTGKTGTADACFSAYSFHDAGYPSSVRLRRGRLLLFLPALLFFLLALVTGSDPGTLFMLMVVIGTPSFLAFLASMFLCHLASALVFSHTLVFIRRRVSPGFQVMRQLDEISPVLKSEYLQEIALTLARRELYSQLRHRDVIDIRYREAMTLLAAHETADGLTVELELYVSNLVDPGRRRLRQKKEVLRLSMRHRDPLSPEEPYSAHRLDSWQLLSLDRRPGSK